MLNGKVAVVTGGTRGIGLATVRKFLQNGATVVLFGSRTETVEKTVTTLKEENANLKKEIPVQWKVKLNFATFVENFRILY